MTDFQSTVRYDLTFGVPGDIIYDGPMRAQWGFLGSASAANNVVGATFFTMPAAGGAFTAGGTLSSTVAVGGILIKPKNYASFGTTANGPLAATMTLQNNINAEFLTMGLVVVSLGAATSIDNLLCYNETTGALSSIPYGTSPGAGVALVPGGKIVRVHNSGAGLAVAQLTI